MLRLSHQLISRNLHVRSSTCQCMLFTRNRTRPPKLRIVFDASAKSATSVSLNDLLLVGPTIHPPLIDILIRFCFYRIAITADISKMYRAIELAPADKNLHRFVWRTDSSKPLADYRMTRVTFGVSASSFAANMCIKQNAQDLALEYPQAAKAVEDCFYVDNCLTGADHKNQYWNIHSSRYKVGVTTAL